MATYGGIVGEMSWEVAVFQSKISSDTSSVVLVESWIPGMAHSSAAVEPPGALGYILQEVLEEVGLSESAHR